MKTFYFINLMMLFFGINFYQATLGMEEGNLGSIAYGIKELQQNKNFVFVDLGIPPETLSFINQNLKIKRTQEYSNFGKLANLKEELTKFLSEIGNDDEQVINIAVETINLAVNNVIAACGKETGWVCVRSFTPYKDAYTPRWHIDGHYYLSHDDISLKFASVLKGNPTLFYNLPPSLREKFNESLDNQQLINELISLDQKEIPEIGQGAFFIVGDMYRAAVHSEPEINKERLFFSIVPGNTSEINELYERWHKPDIECES